MLHDPFHRGEDVGAIVDEALDAEALTDGRLVATLATEVNVRRGNTRSLVEANGGEPGPRAALDLGPALGHEPDPSRETRHEPRERLHGERHLRGPEGFFVGSREERGVGALARAKDAADVDAEVKRAFVSPRVRSLIHDESLTNPPITNH